MSGVGQLSLRRPRVLLEIARRNLQILDKPRKFLALRVLIRQPQ
jgi:hypothetical protein